MLRFAIALVVVFSLFAAACETRETNQVKQRGDYRSDNLRGYGLPR